MQALGRQNGLAGANFFQDRLRNEKLESATARFPPIPGQSLVGCNNKSRLKRAGSWELSSQDTPWASFLFSLLFACYRVSHVLVILDQRSCLPFHSSALAIYWCWHCLARWLCFFNLGRGCNNPFGRFSPKTVFCLPLLALLPIALRLALLPHHPAPTPDIYDEFSHLLVADTLLHFRLANPPHVLPQFFETFFVLQQPTYSSMYPLGQGSVLALGRLLFGHPWAGVLLCTGAFCALSYWMLRAWVTPAWALIGGMLAVFQFGPLNEWTNCYWGGGISAIAGCLAFGALPRIRDYGRKRDAACLGVGLALQILTRPFESVLLLACILLFGWQWKKNWRALIQPAWVTTLVVLPALGLTLLQNKQVTGSWTTLPYSLHQAQYGEPTSLSFQPIPVPQRPLTREQAQEYRAEASFHGQGPETIKKFLLRLEYRVRYIRFFFLPPLYLALFAFAFTLRDFRLVWVALAIAIFVLGTNFFPYFFPRYIATVTCLFLLVSVTGLQRLARSAAGYQAASLILFACTASFALWWTLHLTENPARLPSLLRYETWDIINHENPRSRIDVNQQLARIPGNKLIFVRYGPTHRFQGRMGLQRRGHRPRAHRLGSRLGPRRKSKTDGLLP